MKTLIIYDSVFGNTKLIAEAIAKRISGDVEVIHVSKANTDMSGVGLLVVGSPTRAFNATPATTAYLNSLPAHALDGVSVAAFDTRMDIVKANNKFLAFMVKIFRYAANKIEKKLVAKGGVTRGIQWFFVDSTEGPMAAGEIERAADWLHA
jgi:flavodoxin